MTIDAGARGEPELRSRGGGRADFGVAALVSLVAFVVYVRTAYRTLPGGDSGELIGAVASGGVIHPPGYPLYALLGSLFLRLPAGSLAFRLNLFSAVCDALAAGVLSVAVARAARSRPGGALAGLLFAFAPGVWRYAIAAEVFALNNLLVATLLLLAVAYDATRQRRYAYAGAFALGLGLSNHQTVLFTGLPVVAFALAVGWRDLLRPPVAARLVLAGAAGLLPYLYLPVAASHRAFVSWGAADTWDGFVAHVLRREYGTFRLAPTGVGADVPASDVLDAWWQHARAQWWGGALGGSGLALAAVGVAVGLREVVVRRRWLALAAHAALGLSVGVMVALGNLPIGTALFRDILARFWQQPDLILAAFAGVGVASLASRLRLLPPYAVAGVVTALVAGQLGATYGAVDRHASHLVEDYGREMLRAAPDRAILVTKGDLITNSVRYLQLAEGARPDVRVVDQELLATPWGRLLFEKNAPGVTFPGPRLSLDPSLGFPIVALFDANRASPLMVCGGITPGDHSADATYGLWPAGYCDDVHSGAEPVSIDAWLVRSEAAVPRIDFSGQARPLGSWEEVVWSDTWEVRQARAAHILTVAGDIPARHKFLPVAVGILQRIVDENPDVRPHVHKNLAIAIGRAGIETAADREQAARAWKGYLRVAPADDPQLPAIRKEVERLGG